MLPLSNVPAMTRKTGKVNRAFGIKTSSDEEDDASESIFPISYGEELSRSLNHAKEGSSDIDVKSGRLPAEDLSSPQSRTSDSSCRAIAKGTSKPPGQSMTTWPTVTSEGVSSSFPDVICFPPWRYTRESCQECSSPKKAFQSRSCVKGKQPIVTAARDLFSFRKIATPCLPSGSGARRTFRIIHKESKRRSNIPGQGIPSTSDDLSPFRLTGSEASYRTSDSQMKFYEISNGCDSPCSDKASFQTTGESMSLSRATSDALLSCETTGGDTSVSLNSGGDLLLRNTSDAVSSRRWVKDASSSQNPGTGMLPGPAARGMSSIQTDNREVTSRSISDSISESTDKCLPQRTPATVASRTDAARGEKSTPTWVSLSPGMALSPVSGISPYRISWTRRLNFQAKSPCHNQTVSTDWYINDTEPIVENSVEMAFSDGVVGNAGSCKTLKMVMSPFSTSNKGSSFDSTKIKVKPQVRAAERSIEMSKKQNLPILPTESPNEVALPDRELGMETPSIRIPKSPSRTRVKGLSSSRRKVNCVWSAVAQTRVTMKGASSARTPVKDISEARVLVNNVSPAKVLVNDGSVSRMLVKDKSLSKALVNCTSRAETPVRNMSPARRTVKGKSSVRKPVIRATLMREPVNDKSSDRVPVNGSSQAKALTKNKSPAREPGKEKSPARTPVKEKSSARAPVKGKSPARAPVIKRSPARAPVKDKSLAQALVSDESPARAPVNDCSLTKALVSDKSPARARVKNRSPARTPVTNVLLPKAQMHRMAPARTRMIGFSPLTMALQNDVSPIKIPVENRPSTRATLEDGTPAKGSEHLISNARSRNGQVSLQNSQLMTLSLPRTPVKCISSDRTDGKNTSTVLVSRKAMTLTPAKNESSVRASEKGEPPAKTSKRERPSRASETGEPPAKASKKGEPPARSPEKGVSPANTSEKGGLPARTPEKDEPSVKASKREPQSRASKKGEPLLKVLKMDEPAAKASEKCEPTARIPQKCVSLTRAQEKDEPRENSSEKGKPPTKISKLEPPYRAPKKCEPPAKVPKKGEPPTKAILAKTSEKGEPPAKAAKREPPSRASETGEPPVKTSKKGEPPARVAEKGVSPARAQEKIEPPASTSEKGGLPARTPEECEPPTKESKREPPSRAPKKGEQPATVLEKGELPLKASKMGEPPSRASEKGEPAAKASKKGELPAWAPEKGELSAQTSVKGKPSAKASKREPPPKGSEKASKRSEPPVMAPKKCEPPSRGSKNGEPLAKTLKSEQTVRVTEKGEPSANGQKNGEPLAKASEKSVPPAKAPRNGEPPAKAPKKGEPLARVSRKGEPSAKVSEKSEPIARRPVKVESTPKASKKGKPPARPSLMGEPLARAPMKIVSPAITPMMDLSPARETVEIVSPVRVPIKDLSTVRKALKNTPFLKVLMKKLSLPKLQLKNISMSKATEEKNLPSENQIHDISSSMVPSKIDSMTRVLAKSGPTTRFSVRKALNKGVVKNVSPVRGPVTHFSLDRLQMKQVTSQDMQVKELSSVKAPVKGVSQTMPLEKNLSLARTLVRSTSLDSSSLKCEVDARVPVKVPSAIAKVHCLSPNRISDMVSAPRILVECFPQAGTSMDYLPSARIPVDKILQARKQENYVLSSRTSGKSVTFGESGRNVASDKAQLEEILPFRSDILVAQAQFKDLSMVKTLRQIRVRSKDVLSPEAQGNGVSPTQTIVNEVSEALALVKNVASDEVPLQELSQTEALGAEVSLCHKEVKNDGSALTSPFRAPQLDMSLTEALVKDISLAIAPLENMSPEKDVSLNWLPRKRLSPAMSQLKELSQAKAPEASSGRVVVQDASPAQVSEKPVATSRVSVKVSSLAEAPGKAPRVAMKSVMMGKVQSKDSSLTEAPLKDISLTRASGEGNAPSRRVAECMLPSSATGKDVLVDGVLGKVVSSRKLTNSVSSDYALVKTELEARTEVNRISPGTAQRKVLFPCRAPDSDVTQAVVKENYMSSIASIENASPTGVSNWACSKSTFEVEFNIKKESSSPTMDDIISGSWDDEGNEFLNNNFTQRTCIRASIRPMVILHADALALLPDGIKLGNRIQSYHDGIQDSSIHRCITDQRKTTLVETEQVPEFNSGESLPLEKDISIIRDANGTVSTDLHVDQVMVKAPLQPLQGLSETVSKRLKSQTREVEKIRGTCEDVPITKSKEETSTNHKRYEHDNLENETCSNMLLDSSSEEHVSIYEIRNRNHTNPTSVNKPKWKNQSKVSKQEDFEKHEVAPSQPLFGYVKRKMINLENFFESAALNDAEHSTQPEPLLGSQNERNGQFLHTSSPSYREYSVYKANCLTLDPAVAATKTMNGDVALEQILPATAREDLTVCTTLSNGKEFCGPTHKTVVNKYDKGFLLPYQMAQSPEWCVESLVCSESEQEGNEIDKGKTVNVKRKMTNLEKIFESVALNNAEHNTKPKPLLESQRERNDQFLNASSSYNREHSINKAIYLTQNSRIASRKIVSDDIDLGQTLPVTAREDLTVCTTSSSGKKFCGPTHKTAVKKYDKGYLLPKQTAQSLEWCEESLVCSESEQEGNETDKGKTVNVKRKMTNLEKVIESVALNNAEHSTKPKPLQESERERNGQFLNTSSSSYREDSIIKTNHLTQDSTIAFKKTVSGDVDLGQTLPVTTREDLTVCTTSSNGKEFCRPTHTTAVNKYDKRYLLPEQTDQSLEWCEESLVCSKSEKEGNEIDKGKTVNVKRRMTNLEKVIESVALNNVEQSTKPKPLLESQREQNGQFLNTSSSSYRGDSINKANHLTQDTTIAVGKNVSGEVDLGQMLPFTAREDLTVCATSSNEKDFCGPTHKTAVNKYDKGYLLPEQTAQILEWCEKSLAYSESEQKENKIDKGKTGYVKQKMTNLEKVIESVALNITEHGTKPEPLLESQREQNGQFLDTSSSLNREESLNKANHMTLDSTVAVRKTVNGDVDLEQTSSVTGREYLTVFTASSNGKEICGPIHMTTVNKFDKEYSLPDQTAQSLEWFAESLVRSESEHEENKIDKGNSGYVKKKMKNLEKVIESVVLNNAEHSTQPKPLLESQNERNGQCLDTSSSLYREDSINKVNYLTLDPAVAARKTINGDVVLEQIMPATAREALTVCTTSSNGKEFCGPTHETTVNKYDKGYLFPDQAAQSLEWCVERLVSSESDQGEDKADKEEIVLDHLPLLSNKLLSKTRKKRHKQAETKVESKNKDSKDSWSFSDHTTDSDIHLFVGKRAKLHKRSAAHLGILPASQLDIDREENTLSTSTSSSLDSEIRDRSGRVVMQSGIFTKSLHITQKYNSLTPISSPQNVFLHSIKEKASDIGNGDFLIKKFNLGWSKRNSTLSREIPIDNTCSIEKLDGKQQIEHDSTIQSSRRDDVAQQSIISQTSSIRSVSSSKESMKCTSLVSAGTSWSPNPENCSRTEMYFQPHHSDLNYFDLKQSFKSDRCHKFKSKDDLSVDHQNMNIKKRQCNEGNWEDICITESEMNHEMKKRKIKEQKSDHRNSASEKKFIKRTNWNASKKKQNGEFSRKWKIDNHCKDINITDKEKRPQLEKANHSEKKKLPDTVMINNVKINRNKYKNFKTKKWTSRI